MECGQDCFDYMCGVYNSAMPMSTGAVTEENADMRQCLNVDCPDFEKIFNYCKICQNWYNAEQPRREGETQCPYCRVEQKRLNAIENLQKND